MTRSKSDQKIPNPIKNENGWFNAKSGSFKNVLSAVDNDQEISTGQVKVRFKFHNNLLQEVVG